jgi:hypothetical protein
MPMKLTIDGLKFGDDDIEDVPPGAITVLVGPNNVGKTAILRDIAALTTNPPQVPRQTIVLSDIVLTKAGTTDELRGWLENNGFPLRSEEAFREPYYGSRNQSPLLKSAADGFWSDPKRRLGQLGEYLVATQMTEGRLGLLGGTQVPDPIDDHPKHPLQRLNADPTLMGAYVKLVNRAFGFNVSLNPYGPLDLKIGTPAEPIAAPPDHIEYVRQSRALPFAAQQGDGVRSFLGLALHAIIPAQPIVLIDEPEAFLHPPQARLMGRVLANDTPAESQIIVATHSLDILHGALDSPSRPIKIIRLTRNGGRKLVRCVLYPDDVRDVWKDSLLRYSNLLDGLFHSGVILCEADADCRFYAASVHEVFKLSAELDLLFTHVNGKARLAKAISVLRKFQVPVAAVADFDLINDATVLRRTFEAAGGSWENLRDDYKVVADSVSSTSAPATVGGVRQAAAKVLTDAHESSPLTKEMMAVIASSIRPSGGWEHIKNSGLSAVKNGKPRQAAERIVSGLASVGVFVVPVGELESWVPTSPGKSDQWLLDVLDRSAHLDPSPELSGFLRSVVAAARPDL